MTIKFFSLTDTADKPTLRVSEAYDGDDWGAFCQAFISHFEGIDVDAHAAKQWVDLVEMITPDENEYSEAIFYDGKLVGSVVAPFALDPALYINAK